ncbi:hypothetical protein [Streptomyces sp. MZ04]|uniref:hypothetical protein n=1 Tax=Streptomyces sp. MZ04 TaxID=2559236 RepID=UPI00107E7084|nr:hypothetical protein [Streptomyces sp. MZ04]TGA92518.1 hypothetical protein E2651_36945 [Streptomyces sp. MZ04]
MAVLAVFMPVLMLGIVLALGRYEEWMLPSVKNAGTIGNVGTIKNAGTIGNVGTIANAAGPEEADAVRRVL